MLTPVVEESKWLSILADLPAWTPGPRPLLIVSPHPDDETLGAGGLIADHRSRGFDVAIAAVTDGEKAYPDTPGLAELRIVEQTKALARLGVAASNIIRFGLPDSNLAIHKQELIERLLPLVSAETHIIAPWQGDFHPDHEACGYAAEMVAQKTGARLTSYFFWTWHWGNPDALRGLQLLRFPLTPPLLLAKSEALRCHDSQLQRPDGEPILPDHLLGPARRPFEVFSIA